VYESPTKVHILGTPLEVSVFNQRDDTSVISSVGSGWMKSSPVTSLRQKFTSSVQEETLMSSVSFVERVRIGGRVDFHEKTTLFQYKT
jgi:hypothetical protein